MIASLASTRGACQRPKRTTKEAVWAGACQIEGVALIPTSSAWPGDDDGLMTTHLNRRQDLFQSSHEHCERKASFSTLGPSGALNPESVGIWVDLGWESSALRQHHTPTTLWRGVVDFKNTP